MNFHRYDQYLASAAQPTTDQFRHLKEEGWEAVVNISPPSTRNALKEEAAIVEGLGLDYVHFPVDCSNLRSLHYLTFRGIMRGLEGKRVLVHCGGNIKSSNLIYMYQVLELGVPEAEAFATLKTIQNPEPKWFDYFEAMGMSKGEIAA
jgi:protein tyrosine phosphatase (PTP) superfamily phosphohydrolase (DUF442 family)